MGLGWGPRLCISNKPLGDANAAGLWPHLEYKALEPDSGLICGGQSGDMERNKEMFKMMAQIEFSEEEQELSWFVN